MGLGSWQDHREESEILPMAKTSSLKKEQKEKKRMDGPSQERFWP